MSQDWLDSVVLVTSSDPQIDKFGTAFLVHQDDQTAFVVTCAHVVRDVGGQESARIADASVTVVALGTEHDDIDLAVLQVTGLRGKRPLPLSNAGEKDRHFIIPGYQVQGHSKQYLVRPLAGEL